MYAVSRCVLCKGDFTFCVSVCQLVLRYDCKLPKLSYAANVLCCWSAVKQPDTYLPVSALLSQPVTILSTAFLANLCFGCNSNLWRQSHWELQIASAVGTFLGDRIICLGRCCASWWSCYLRWTDGICCSLSVSGMTKTSGLLRRSRNDATNSRQMVPGSSVHPQLSTSAFMVRVQPLKQPPASTSVYHRSSASYSGSGYKL